jgi:predicted MFS family arabinose efflux permease
MASRLGSRFDKLSFAAGISNLGDGAFGAAFPLLVASLTRDPALVAGATFASRLPWFLFALISGALVDRMDRQRVMVVVNSLRALGFGLLALSVATASVDIVVVYVVAFALGVAETFFDTSSEAIIPRLVEPEHLPAANARLQGLEFVANSFAGPPLGAFLFTVMMAAPFIFNAGSYAVAAVALALIGGGYRSHRAPTMAMRQEIGAGLAWLWGQRVVRTVSMLAGATNMLTFAIIAVFVLYAQDILDVSDTGYGIMLATIGVGGLAGALFAPRVVARLGPGGTLRLALFTQLAVVAVFTLLTSPVAAGALLFFYGATITMWNVVSVSLRQSLTPDELRGRVAGAARTLAFGSMPIGALLGGMVASAFGLRAPFVFAGLGYVVAIALAWRIISNPSIEAAKARAAAI